MIHLCSQNCPNCWSDRLRHLHDTWSSQHKSQWQKKPRGVRTLCAQDTQDLFPGRQGSLGLESRGHSERPPPRMVISSGKLCFRLGEKKNRIEEKALTAHHVALSRLRPSASCHSSSREKVSALGFHVRWHQPPTQEKKGCAVGCSLLLLVEMAVGTQVACNSVDR